MAKRTTKKTPARRAPARRAPEREREPAREERGGGDREYGRRNSRGRGPSDLTRMGGLWKKRTKKGDPMLSGLVNVGEFLDFIEQHGLKAEDRAPLLVLVNNYKKEDRHPDFNLFGVDPESRKRNGNSGGRGGRSYNRDSQDRGRGGDRDFGGGDNSRRYERQNDDPRDDPNSLD